MIKTLKGTALEELVMLCKQMYLEGKWPKDFVKSVVVPLKKKPGAKKCEEHRTINLIFHASKIMLNILRRRPEKKISEAIGQDQFGFIN